MSRLLSRTLHDAVDLGRPDADLAVDALAGRIRRRRTARAGGRAAVGVGAAGAVAVGAVQVAERQGATVAADGSGADLCGVAVESLPPDPGPAWLALGQGVDVHRTLQQHLRRPDRAIETHLGVSDPHWLQFALVRRNDDGDAPREGTQVLLAQDGRVVAWGQDTMPGDERWRLQSVADPAASGVWEAGTVFVSPQPCDDTDAVPAGSYDVYVAQAPGTGFAGPWTTEVSRPPAGIAVPAGFPTGLPLPEGTLLDAIERPDGAWSFTLRAVGVNPGADAQAALEGEGAPTYVDPETLQDDRFPSGAFVSPDDRWLVWFDLEASDDGGMLLRYDVAPR